jgi:beta-galactosidase
VAAFAEAVRNPQPSYATALRVELGRFARSQFAEYFQVLRQFAEESGMGGVPLYVNIHGTDRGSGATFPIGISQLFESYSGVPNFAAGADHYLGDLNLRSASDLHMMNAYLNAVNGPDQPLTELEFEAGNGDYGDDLYNDVDPAAVVLKTRLCLAQGAKLLNYYLFAGGTNFVADPPRLDGTTRFGITGERHGFAAPLTPEGTRSPSFEPTATAMNIAGQLAPLLAGATEEHDDLALGFVPDYYLTEYRPGNEPDVAGGPRSLVSELEYARGLGPRTILGRVLLTLGYRYGAVNLQAAGPWAGADNPVAENPQVAASAQVLSDAPESVQVERKLAGEHSLTSPPLPHLVVLGSPVLMPALVQQRLVAHLQGGGALLLVGSVPMLDLDGTPCRVLADYLGVADAETVTDGPHNFLSVIPTLGRGTERRVGRLQSLALNPSFAGTREPILTRAVGAAPHAAGASQNQGAPLAPDAAGVGPNQGVAPASNGENAETTGAEPELMAAPKPVCGVVSRPAAGGVAAIVGCDFGWDADFWESLFTMLGVSPGLKHAVEPGLIALSTRGPAGRLLHVINVAPRAVTTDFTLDNQPLLGGEAITIPPKTGFVTQLG